MGVNMDAIRQRAQEEEAKQLARSAGAVRYWNPKVGKNRVRLLPPWTSEGPNRDSFYREVYMHFKVGLNEDDQKTFVCLFKTPHIEKQTCPVCSYVEKLRNTQDPGDAELAKDISGKQRFYSNIIDLEDPLFTDQDVAEWKASQQDKTKECPFKPGESKVKLFAYGSMIWGQLMNIFTNSHIDVTDLNAGHDIIITKTGEGRHTKYTVGPNLQPSPFLVRGKPISEALYNLDTLSPPATPQQMSEALMGLGTLSGSVNGAANGAPSLPPPSTNMRPPAAAQLPPAQAPAAAPAVRQTAPAPAPAAAPAPAPAAAPKFLPLVLPDGAPPCFGNWSKTLPEEQRGKVCNPEDPECVGGQKGEDIYDPCPYYSDCLQFRTEAEAAEKPKAPSRRTAAKRSTPTVPDTSTPQVVDDLEAEMRNAMKS